MIQPVFPRQSDESDESGEQEAITPQVFILSSGEVTPFVVVLESRQSPARYHLSVSLMGQIETQHEQTL